MVSVKSLSGTTSGVWRHLDDPDEAERVFHALAEGGRVRDAVVGELRNERVIMAVQSGMNDEEAAALLEQELRPLRRESYGDLVKRIGSDVQTVERQGSGGAAYQIEIQVCWDHRPGGNIHVMGSIDDGGWRAFRPLTRDFIKTPDGSFVGE
jgi:hypothetical protein